MIKRVAVIAGLLFFCAWSVVRVAVPPRPVPATSPDTVFSAERAMRHVENIAVRPHAVGMPDHDRVRDYIVAQLTGLGLRPQVQSTTAIGTRYRSAGRVQNILAWIPGSDPKGKAVLVAAHYDGVEAGPAAGDDGAGSAAILETVRALRARQKPLAHDVIVVFTDGEEAGLLGAAAFVREHPWAKDVAVIINFEARGTTGRSFMFETGPGDRAAVGALAHVGNATAGSVFTTVYRTLANDTDLSEFAVLGVPALNFAFASGVERYHTSHDDFAFLNPASVQHHGSQMLGLVKTLASGPLPLPPTGDAVFFDLPLVGLIFYPLGFALPLAIVALVLVGVVVYRVRHGVIAGVVMSIVAIAISAAATFFVAGFVNAMQPRLPWGGAPQWNGVHGAGEALLAIAITVGCYSAAKRWSDEHGLHAGALVVWAIAAVVVSAKAPGASYLFVWPTLLAAAAMLSPNNARAIVRWIAVAVSILLLAGLAYGVAVVMLGVAGPGAIALGVLTSLVVLVNLPVLEKAGQGSRFTGAAWVASAAVLVLVAGVFVVRQSAAHPMGSVLVYAQNADSTDAWFGSTARFRDPWTRAAVGPTTAVPPWTNRIAGAFAGRKVERVVLEAPNAVLVRDTVINGARRVVLRVTAPRGTTALRMRAAGARVSSASIDDRVVDTTRYRNRSADWVMEYWAVPDAGAIVALSIPPGETLDLELASRTPGLPAVPGIAIPRRPGDVVPIQTGDITYVYKRMRF